MYLNCFQILIEGKKKKPRKHVRHKARVNYKYVC
jgi:hypothetical protein